MKAIAYRCKEPLRWTSPFGLQVVQSINDWKQLAIYSFMGFQQIKLTNRKDIDEMRPNAMAKAIVPNYIHISMQV